MTVQILRGDCRAVLKTLPADSVHCCVTSPPYWGLRSYLPAGHADKPLEIGSEPTLREFIDTMTGVMMLAREVLGNRSYKSDDKAKQTPERLIARKDLVEALEQGRSRLGLRLRVRDGVSGDGAIGAVLAVSRRQTALVRRAW